MLSVLDPRRIEEHAGMLSSVILGDKGAYFDALNRIQNRVQIVPRVTGNIGLVFDLDDQAIAFVSGVLAESDLSDLTVGRLPAHFDAEIRLKVVEALRLLESYHPKLPMSVRSLIGTLLFVEVDNCASASSRDALGTVWISPREDWTAARYGEAICHELAHQALFLEDMISPIFQFDSEEPLIVSSIRRSKRPYESSFHAAIVAGALIEMYLALGLSGKAAEFWSGLAESVAEFEALPQFLTRRGLELVAELRQIVSRTRSLLSQTHESAIA